MVFWQSFSPLFLTLHNAAYGELSISGTVLLHCFIHKTKDIYYSQKQLGHSSIQIIVDRYGHLLNENAEVRGVDCLEDPGSTLTALKAVD